MMRRVAVGTFGLIVLMGLAGSAQSIADPVEYRDRAWVNWEAGVMKAKGFGHAPKDAMSPAHGELLARRAAIVDGYRMLVEMAEVIVRRSETVLREHAVQVDEVVVAAQGVVRGAQILEERVEREGVYSVVLGLPLTGSQGLGKVLYPRILPPGPGPQPESVQAEPGAYTGLIVVVRGLAAQRSMAPRLVTRSGEVVYGQWAPGTVDPEFANRVGVAGYPASASRSRRGGPKPLVVEAIGVAGLARTDIVVSEADAARIREANARGRFLERFAVEIVIEP